MGLKIWLHYNTLDLWSRQGSVQSKVSGRDNDKNFFQINLQALQMKYYSFLPFPISYVLIFPDFKPMANISSVLE